MLRGRLGTAQLHDDQGVSVWSLILIAGPFNVFALLTGVANLEGSAGGHPSTCIGHERTRRGLSPRSHSSMCQKRTWSPDLSSVAVAEVHNAEQTKARLTNLHIPAESDASQQLESLSSPCKLRRGLRTCLKMGALLIICEAEGVALFQSGQYYKAYQAPPLRTCSTTSSDIFK